VIASNTLSQKKGKKDGKVGKRKEKKKGWPSFLPCFPYPMEGRKKRIQGRARKERGRGKRGKVIIRVPASTPSTSSSPRESAEGEENLGEEDRKRRRTSSS